MKHPPEYRTQKSESSMQKVESGSGQGFLTVSAFLLVALEQGSDVSCGPQTQALSGPLHWQGRLKRADTPTPPPKGRRQG
jgi:hypothetical protein